MLRASAGRHDVGRARIDTSLMLALVALLLAGLLTSCAVTRPQAH